MKMKLPWMNGNKVEPLDAYLGKEVLSLAQGDPTVEQSFKHSPELRGATYAIIEALPKKARKHVTNDTKVDIAAVIVLQRAAAYQEALVAHGLAGQPEEAESEYAIPQRTDMGSEEET